MGILAVKGLCKAYESFALRDITFSLEAGKITGFIGRNGAGKTTTLKSILQFVHPDSGEVDFFGLPFVPHQAEIKQQIGFVSGGVDFYPQKKLKTITGIYRRFYANWDDAAYKRYITLFALDENKTPAKLSAGMRVKYMLALALSHRATLLLLDEPTSGLDPVSRDELLDVFLRLVEEEGVTILFSTHITSDLDRCADHILYIQNGQIIADSDMDVFTNGYRLVQMEAAPKEAEMAKLIGLRKDRAGYMALIKAADLPLPEAKVQTADLETIMIHLERGAAQ